MSTSSALWAIPLVSLISGTSSPKIVNETYNQSSSYNSLITHQDKPFVSNNNLLESIQPKYVIEFRSKPANEWMIMVNNQPAFLVKNLPDAVIASAKLTMTMNAPDFDPRYLEPMAIDGEYLGKYKMSSYLKFPNRRLLTLR